MNLLLRKMTRKSIIGFGNFRDHSVQNLIDLGKEKELIKIYYNLSKIDYNDDVKECLRITKEREIEKPGKDPSAYMKNIYNMVCEISEAKGELATKMLRKEHYYNKRHTKVVDKIIQQKINNPMLNMHHTRRSSGKENPFGKC